ncbi:hypothetical protein [Natrinema pallidum]|uniref:Domain of unknown function domain-containing protein n=1 Tax=Natrinema pallidum DSM 3751 TaxID=1227495 RepID=L9YJ93_9EURY|nr:hypothetical protein [Natrinema pallidum]ELY73542.1 hypothetical protein C487_17345 [Natrinema pallidum DSM 3751]
MSDEELQAYDLDRDRGILTPEDRKFLLGQTEYKHPQSARRRRAKIRQRITNAFLDFTILEFLQERDRNQIFTGEDRRSKLGGGFASAFTFLYDALIRSREDNAHVDMNLNIYLEQAIETVDQSRGYRTEFEMDIEREELEDPNKIFRRAKDEGFHTLTSAEFELLWNSEEVDAAAFASFINQLLEDEKPISATDIQKERRAIREMKDDLEL